ncbi:MAG: HEAT repeat domain-containing protein [Mastigocoleus sp.]
MTDIQKLINTVEEADSASKLLDAVEELAAAKSPASTPNLIAALSYNNPGAAVAAVDGLIGIGKPAVKPLLELIDAHNYTARAWAIRALAGIGDPRGLETLLDAADNDFALSVRRAAARGLGTVLWDEMVPEGVKAAQIKVLDVLMRVCKDPEWVVRYAAVSGLENLAQSTFNTYVELVLEVDKYFLELLETEENLTVQSRIKLALQRLQQLTIERELKSNSQSEEEEKEKSHRGGGRR